MKGMHLDHLPPAAHQRARGSLLVRVGVRDGRTVLRDLFQEGCLKARFPRGEGWMEAVMLNTSGGVAGGDALDGRFVVEAGAQATFSAQAAERFYRALPDSPASAIDTRIELAGGAAAEWLPQETILFDRCAVARRLAVSLAADAWFLGVESLVFGRAAMGERVRTGRISDTIAVRRNGRLVLHDAIRLSGEVGAALGGPATARGAGAVATLVHVAPDAEARLDDLRAAWDGAPAEAGASAWDGMLVGRVVARDGAALRVAVTRGLQALRGSRPLPRVWMC